MQRELPNNRTATFSCQLPRKIITTVGAGLLWAYLVASVLLDPLSRLFFLSHAHPCVCCHDVRPRDSLEQEVQPGECEAMKTTYVTLCTCAYLRG